MHIRHVSIENIRRFGLGAASVDLSLPPRGWIVGAGPNGSGKTTFLQVLALALSPMLQHEFADTLFYWLRQRAKNARSRLTLVPSSEDKLRTAGATDAWATSTTREGAFLTLFRNDASLVHPIRWLMGLDYQHLDPKVPSVERKEARAPGDARSPGAHGEGKICGARRIQAPALGNSTDDVRRGGACRCTGDRFPGTPCTDAMRYLPRILLPQRVLDALVAFQSSHRQGCRGRRKEERSQGHGADRRLLAGSAFDQSVKSRGLLTSPRPSASAGRRSERFRRRGAVISAVRHQHARTRSPEGSRTRTRTRTADGRRQTADGRRVARAA